MFFWALLFLTVILSSIAGIIYLVVKVNKFIFIKKTRTQQTRHFLCNKCGDYFCSNVCALPVFGYGQYSYCYAASGCILAVGAICLLPH